MLREKRRKIGQEGRKDYWDLKPTGGDFNSIT